MIKERLKACVNVYLVLYEQNKILFSLRQNTGYEDGCYSFVAGHVEEGETPSQAMIREAEEEAGILIAPCDIQVVHAMHRRTNRDNIDLFLACHQWEGQLSNREQLKCGDLTFFSHPPHHTVEYIKFALDQIRAGNFYSEFK